ncbi:hypothetical protein ABEP17_18990 [Priestia flexa]|uniref:Uncharacterized protein n=1 Tax=Priestia flexa TaxID=86664 RepID=A0ABU4J678_9BACI|nr:hypothetical protein [Priestia flexa]USY55416.1 hypothetical protein NIZ91_01630 [Bacillus sp. 1780r2a1]MCG7315330.1 hypothetical protein [Priestia flexa]MDT2048526.1 hypothetical protein [Priestia flexa]MDW8516494.1 hypothetical protein [Priestia flexa]MEC0666551.1 hypothetical protein [Priestia flexa]
MNFNKVQFHRIYKTELVKQLEELCEKGYISPFLLKKFIELAIWRKTNERKRS